MRSTIRGTLRPLLAVVLVGSTGAKHTIGGPVTSSVAAPAPPLTFSPTTTTPNVLNDPAGVPHPGCLPASGTSMAPYNTSCPGIAMSAVYDWESEVLPFNTQQITEGLTRFIYESGWDNADFVGPTLGVSSEDGDPPTSKTELTYTFSSFQSGSPVTKDIDGLNADIQQEAFSMHLAQETSAFNTYLAGEDATSVATPSDAFEQALRDAFDAHRVTNDAIHAGDSPSAGAGAPATALSAFNDLLEVEILALRVTQERDAFDSYVSKHGYGTSLSGVDIEDAVGDIDSFNTANEALYKSTYISEQDAKLQTFLAGQGLQSVVSVNVDTSNFQNATDIKRAVGDQASADWKAKRADDQTTYLTNNDLANEGLGGIDDAMSNIVTWNAQAVTAARTKYLADSGLAAQGVTVGQFGDGSGFNYTATPTNGAAQYGGDPPAFAVTPVFVAPGVFSFSPAYAWTTYALTKTHAHSAYALSEPGSFNVTAFTWPTHIHKRNFISLSVYHKHWYMQLDDRCQATCSGSQHATTDRDTDALAGDRVACDPDDLVCPAGNAQPAYEEFQGIIKSLHNENTVHPECPVDDPCLLTPPPCFYVSTECVPTNVVDLQLDNSAQRTQERGTPAISADDLYLHEPLVMDDVVEWKLVSSVVAHDSPKLWDYNDGIVMEAYVSPVDSRPYHKTCTFALTPREWSSYGAPVEYGFSIAETARKNREGPTQSGQNSYMAPNHVYDVGHTVPKEMWQRSFGETVSPQLFNQCSAIFAGSWRNRAYTPAQTLASPSFVFGTCMETCDAMTSLGEQSGRTIETYPAFLGERERSGRNFAFLGAASPGDERFGNGAAFELGGVALCALVAAAALAANGSVKKAKDFVEARTGTAEERRTLSAV